MTNEHWGAFSVIDYKDARKLAAEVLLYDRLLIPTPMDWDRARWVERGWEPERLDKRLKQLGDIGIGAAWDQDAQKNWKQKFDALHQDIRDINSALQTTRRVLVDHAREYRPKGVDAILAFEAYQSEDDFHERHGSKRPPLTKQTQKSKAKPTPMIRRMKLMAEFDFLVAQRIAIPEEQDPEEALKRALDLANKKKFRDRRSRFHDWQHDMLSRGVIPQDAAKALSHLVAEYNHVVRSSSRSYRVETAMLVWSLGATAIAALSGVAPALFVGIGMGVFTGAKVVSIGTAATGAILQIAKHIRSRRDPDNTTRIDLSGAMFHQIEEETGWRLRAEHV